MSLPAELLKILVCPRCHSPLEYRETPHEVLICRNDGLVFQVDDGVPVLLLDEAKPLDETQVNTND